MRLSDFEFELPPELIAKHPLAQRSASRLLHVEPWSEATTSQGTQTARLHDRQIHELPGLLEPGDLLVFNDSKVIPARLKARKTSGGQVEIMIERVLDDRHALALLRVSNKPAAGSELLILDHQQQAVARVRVLGRQDDLFHLRFDQVWDTMDRYGELPLPPYMERPADTDDLTRYQTVYARYPGSVAAPTAGLHFDAALLEHLQARSVTCAQVTLHVGAGTFLPVRNDDLSTHTMHREWYHVPEATVSAIAETRARGGKVIAVGTTSLRTLESASDDDGQLRAGSGETQLFITPGYRFRQVDRLLTNFHLPASTLLMLVSAFAGYDTIRAAYAHAIAQRYRFFSYGDAMLLSAAQAPLAATVPAR